MHKIRKGDDVIVTTGRDKGKRGSVIDFVGEQRVLVEGVNRSKKHVKPNPMKVNQGGIIEKEMPLHISNIALFNTSTNSGSRVGIKVLEDGAKVRFFKCNDELVGV